MRKGPPDGWKQPHIFQKKKEYVGRRKAGLPTRWGCLNRYLPSQQMPYSYAEKNQYEQI
jgi:hypothetical protein